ncbi:MAG: hypothetical protein D3923_09660 [Candidatus Electrothrix sp. AR3]|nr:hypothetical protein [Candidatus Electrothrix sp. AR3]
MGLQQRYLQEGNLFMETVSTESLLQKNPANILQQSEPIASSQPWNRIDFSNRPFSDLPPHLVAALETAERATINRLLSGFEFPLLIAPDPRALKTEQEREYLREYQQPEEEALPMWPEPESLVSETAPENFLYRRKGTILAYLLTAAFIFSLLWISAQVMLPKFGNTVLIQHLEMKSLTLGYKKDRLKK